MKAHTKTNVSQELILAARQGLQPVGERSWLGGFGNMLGKELADWFGTRRWLVQMIIWIVIINGLMGFIMFVVPMIDPESQLAGADERLAQGLSLFFNFAVIFGVIGMMILAQDEIIQEKQTGTAAWILTKPVSRSSFILTKLLSNFIGAFLFIALIPGAIAYAEIYIDSRIMLPVVPYLLGIGAVQLALTFYLALVIMLGTLFEQRGPVLGVAAGVFIGSLILSQFFPQASYFLPVNIPLISAALAQGEPIPGVAVSQLAVTAAWSILFTLVALLRFRRTEM